MLQLLDLLEMPGVFKTVDRESIQAVLDGMGKS
jgi:hypothetical protein